MGLVAEERLGHKARVSAAAAQMEHKNLRGTGLPKSNLSPPMRHPFLLLLITPLLAHATSIWVEGEAATKKDTARHGWYDGVKRELLSGVNWLSHYGDRPAAAAYEVNV